MVMEVSRLVPSFLPRTKLSAISASRAIAIRSGHSDTIARKDYCGRPTSAVIFAIDVQSWTRFSSDRLKPLNAPGECSMQPAVSESPSQSRYSNVPFCTCALRHAPLRYPRLPRVTPATASGSPRDCSVIGWLLCVVTLPLLPEHHQLREMVGNRPRASFTLSERTENIA